MSKHSQKKKEYVENRLDGVISITPEKAYKIKEQNQLQDTQDNFVSDDSSIALLAYQIHQEKGGSELDNWLDAERILRSREDLTNIKGEK
jgi:hypothetical protein